MDRKKTLISCAIGCSAVLVLLIVVGGSLVYINRDAIQAQIESGKEYIEQSAKLTQDLNKEFNVVSFLGFSVSDGVSTLAITIQNPNLPEGEAPKDFAKRVAAYAANYDGFDDYDHVEVTLIHQKSGAISVSRSEAFEWTLEQLKAYNREQAITPTQPIPEANEAEQAEEPEQGGGNKP